MSRKVYITPETSITEEIEPYLKKLSKNDSKFFDKSLDTAHQVKQHLKNSALNSPNIHQYITRTIDMNGHRVTIVGAMKKPSWFRRLFS